MADSRFTTIFGITGAEEQANIVRVAVEAVRRGYAVIPLPPGRKTPMCTLTSREVKAADTEAQAQGLRKHDCGVHHAITDDLLARKVFTRLQREAGEHQLNIGIVAYPSRIIVVDADTGPAVAAFQRFLADQEGDDAYLEHTPTVLTPGARDEDGKWKHRDGGHYYYRLPEDVTIDLVNGGVLGFPEGFQIRWGYSMTVAPPSVRAEGPYVAQGNVPEAPAWMLKMITEHNERAAERRALRGSWHVNDSIASWSVSVSWAELLTADGWSDTSKVDTCGCPIFEKPGGGSTTYKSATGHEAECDKWENLEGHGPLHIWTDDPPAPLDDYIIVNGKTITKLRYVALTRYGDDVDLAKVELGIDKSVEFGEWTGTMATVVEAPTTITTITTKSLDAESFLGVASVVKPATTPTTNGDVADCGDFATPTLSESPHSEGDDDEGVSALVSGTLAVVVADGPAEGVVNPDTTLSLTPEPFLAAEMEALHVPTSELSAVKVALKKELVSRAARNAVDAYVRALDGDGELSLLDEIDAFVATDFTDAAAEIEPEFLVREDGTALIYRSRVNYLIGRKGCGKTWLAMLACTQALLAGQRVLYTDLEDNWKLFRKRMADMGFDPEPYVRSGALVYVRKFEKNDLLLPAYVRKLGTYDLVIFDVINRMISALGGNPDIGNEEVIWLSNRVFDPIADLETAVLVLDHPNKAGQSKEATVDDLLNGGGAMKGNNASGHMIGMLTQRPFSQENPEGHVTLYCKKDRPGNFTEDMPCGEFRGRADVVSGHVTLNLRVDSPEGHKEPSVQDAINPVKARILTLLAVGAISAGGFSAKVDKHQRQWVDMALAQLKDEGKVILTGKSYSLPAAAV